ncbi:hypothetical protein PG984_012898 [Apiospora sp. TS-2023a]
MAPQLHQLRLDVIPASMNRATASHAGAPSVSQGCPRLWWCTALPNSIVTYSALIYTLRLLIGSDIPLNQGCLAPTKVILPKGSFLNPSAGPAVCCGNTLTSQRLVDLLLKAFRAAAGSQGCMNCFGFFGNCADEDGEATNKDGFGFGYGETICGGEGAGPTWHGASWEGGHHHHSSTANPDETQAVQVHMTNTRTTDPEILEKRYPILLREFSIRRGSGGRGRFSGGDGVVRDWECRAPLTFGLITERRVHRPYGMFGGEAGSSGVNYWVQKGNEGEEEGEEGERWINIGSRGQVDMQRGDRCVIHTPGGGGWGRSEDFVEDEIDRIVRGEFEHDGGGTRRSNGAGAGAKGKVEVVYPRATGSFHAHAAAQEASS